MQNKINIILTDEIEIEKIEDSFCRNLAEKTNIPFIALKKNKKYKEDFHNIKNIILVLNKIFSNKKVIELFIIKLLLLFLKENKIPVTGRSLCNNFCNIKNIIDFYFPGFFTMPKPILIFILKNYSII